MKLIKIFLVVCMFSFDVNAGNGINLSVPPCWHKFASILQARHEQPQSKMKLTTDQLNDFVDFLAKFKQATPELLKLQDRLPKTTLELLRAIQSRGLSVDEAERVATYLYTTPEKFLVKNTTAFDENTSHIIGREWHEIDYHGEGMTWEKQQQKYAPYGITNFKTLDNLSKFFPIESKLPYFQKVYG